ncbi:nuclear division defective protein 1 [Monosporozyma unispora]
MDQHSESKMGAQARSSDEDMLRSGSNLPITNDMGSTDAQFFRVLSDNMKYVFNSPIPTKTQFPTPYSSNQLDSSQQQDLAISNNSMENGNNNISFHRNPDSSFIDRTLNPQLYANNSNNNNNNNNSNNTSNNTNNINKNGIVTDALQDINIQPSSALQFSAVESTTTKQSNLLSKNKNSNNTTTTNNNIASTNINNNNNLTVPNNNNNNTNIQTDFLLPSPVQLREFLYDSPAGINFFHNTPARSPLKFLNEDTINPNNNNNNGPSSSNLMHLFNTVNNINDPDNNGIQDNNNNNLTDLWDKISTNTRTPLRKIDINLMFNNGQLLTNSNTMSPLKKLSMSLTPYGRRILNDMGTPFNNNPITQNNNNNGMVTSSGIKNTLVGTSNSALIDFQRARKDTTITGPPILDNNNLKKSIVSMSPSTNTNSLDITIRSPKLVITPKKTKGGRNKKNLNSGQIPKLHKNDNSTNNIILNRRTSNIDARLDNDGNDMEFDGSSPTTIQLNSSVTKSLPKMNMNTTSKLIDRIPVLSRNMTMLEKNSLDVTLSPTPRSNINLPMDNNNNNKLKFLPVPDLPKMGSFKSERTASTLTNSDFSSSAPSTQVSNIPSRLPSISTFPSTTILPPQTQPRKTIVKKKKKVTKAKKPKFQIFVSSVHKFSDPNSSIPLSTLKNNTINPENGHKIIKRGKK